MTRAQGTDQRTIRVTPRETLRESNYVRATRHSGAASRRRITAWTGAGVLAATLGVGTTGIAEAAPSSGAATVATATTAMTGTQASVAARGERGGERGAERHRGKPGFTPVRQLGTISGNGKPVAMTAPAKGVVFVLSADADKKAEVQRITTTTRRGSTSTSVVRYRLGTPLGDPGRATIDGTAANDVWVTANGGLWRFDGRRFTKLSLPHGESAVTVADEPGSGVYVGTESASDGGEVWRGTVGRRGDTSWKSTGHASREGFPDYGLPILGLRVVDDRVFGMWAQQYSANLARVVYELDSGSWVSKYTANTWHPSGGTTEYTWLAPKAGEQVLLERYETHPGAAPVLLTKAWSSGELNGCLRGKPEEWVSQKGVVLADGRLITDGFFVSLGACNRPRRIAGDPGNKTLTMTAERGSNAAWAVTQHGDRVQLQRFTG